MSKSKSVGRAGEFLSAYILETYGIEVHHVDRDGADLWCKVQGSILTVQVKSSSKPMRYGHDTKEMYSYHTPKTIEVDWYCFVALDKQLLLMRKSDSFETQKLRISPNEFNEVNQRRTIEEFMESC